MSPLPLLSSTLAEPIRRFIDHKRALGRRFDTEVGALRLFDRYLTEHGVGAAEDVTPEMIEAFMASRPRSRPRSYNHLLFTVRRLFNWLIAQDELTVSPVLLSPRRGSKQRRPFIFDSPAARRLLARARTFPDNPKAPMRGSTYHMIFAILYGLGLRVGEVSRLRYGDIDLDRAVLLVQKSKFYKSRLVPFGPRMATALLEYAQARSVRYAYSTQEAPFFSFTSRGPIHPCTISQTFHHLVPQLGLNVPRAARRRGCMT